MAQQMNGPQRSNSISQASDTSQTAQEFINSQLQLEAEAREALPYQFDTCTRPLGALRQSLFACLTCNPPPKSLSDFYTPAAVCYSCSISCHGEHNLVELFAKRNFVCDCGTTRLPSTYPCTLRIQETTGIKGGVHSEAPVKENKYNQNFRNRFCGCSDEYDPHQEKGTMFQCLGLGTVEDGGCGEDWWHPECVVGLARDWYKKRGKEGAAVGGEKPADADQNRTNEAMTGSKLDQSDESLVPKDESANDNDGGQALAGVPPNAAGVPGIDEDDDPPLPPNFPQEDSFDAFLCYKCIEAFPWIKQYAGTPGFLPAVFYNPVNAIDSSHQEPAQPGGQDIASTSQPNSNKRKASEELEEHDASSLKRQKSAEGGNAPGEDSAELLEALPSTTSSNSCYRVPLPLAPTGRFSLFMKEGFRTHFCRCPSCFPLLSVHPQLLEEEENYEPPISEDGDANGGSVGTGSLLDRGEAALSNVDRVRAIEGVMVYNHLRDKVKAFLTPFAESKQAVGAEDIKKYFEKLRGDHEAIRAAAGVASAHASKSNEDEGEDGGEGSDRRREQSGY